MKIKSLKLKNFAQFSDFEIEYNDKVTKLVGVNGSGKTTVGLTAIWACLKGISEKNRDGQLIGERFRFIGSQGETSDVELILVDEKENRQIIVTNYITKSGNSISFSAVGEYDIDENWLKNILSVSLMSAANFTDLNGKAQAILLGIDTKPYDEEIKQVKSEFTLLNRDLKNLGKIEAVEKVEEVSVKDLIDKRLEAEKNNNKIKEFSRLIKDEEFVIEATEKKIEELKGSISGKKSLISAWREEMTKLCVMDISAIAEEINSVEETNKKAAKYEEYRKEMSKCNAISFEITSNRQELQKKEQARLNYVKSFDFGIEGLSVDEKGSLLLNDKPIKDPYFSRGELEVIVAKLHIYRNPDFKVRFLDDFDLLDEENQIDIVDNLLKHGFQVITAEVGKVKTSDNCVLLRECAISEESK